MNTIVEIEHGQKRGKFLKAKRGKFLKAKRGKFLKAKRGNFFFTQELSGKCKWSN